MSLIIVMKENLYGRKKRLGGLPFPPYEANITSDVSTAAGSLKIPDFQPLNANSIESNMQNVKSVFSDKNDKKSPNNLGLVPILYQG